MQNNHPTFQDVLRAKQTVSRYLPRTPLHHYSALDKLVGARVLVKHENHQPVGAFKVRGGINLLSQLSDDERARGVIAASTGNHGQSVAYAAREFGVRATIIVPERANPMKGAHIRLGGELDTATQNEYSFRAAHPSRFPEGVPPDAVPHQYAPPNRSCLA